MLSLRRLTLLQTYVCWDSENNKRNYDEKIDRVNEINSDNKQMATLCSIHNTFTHFYD